MRNFSDSVLRNIREKTYQFSEDTFFRIQDDFIETLSKAYQEGIGNNETIMRLRKDFKGLRDYRLRTIVRTELQNSQNVGINMTLQEYGVQYKQWLSARDNRTRDSHVLLHGEVRRYEEPYSNGLMYSTDRNGDISEWISCRCRQRPYIPKPDETIMITPYFPMAS